MTSHLMEYDVSFFSLSFHTKETAEARLVASVSYRYVRKRSSYAANSSVDVQPLGVGGFSPLSESFLLAL